MQRAWWTCFYFLRWLLSGVALLALSCSQSPPLYQSCDNIEGSCLALRVLGSGSFAQLRVRVEVSGATSPMPTATGDQAATLPVLILLTPPPQVLASQIQRLYVDALDDQGTVQRTGSTSVAWPDGQHSEAVVTLGGQDSTPDQGGTPDSVVTNLMLPSFDDVYATGDFNGDGRIDFAAAALVKKTVHPYLNDGQGGFAPAATTTTFPIGFSSILAADVNRDKKTDIIVWDSMNIVAALANGGGGFVLLTAQKVSTANIVGVAAGDFVGDDNTDLMIMTSGMLTPWMGNGQGQFTAGTAVPIAAGYPTDSLVGIGPVDAGKHGVAVMNTLEDNLTVYAMSSGTLSKFGSQKLQIDLLKTFTGDMDNDGSLDLMLTGGTQELRVLKNNGHGSFALFAQTGTKPVSSNTRLVAIDFDRDGNPDLAAGSGGGLSLFSIQTGSLMPLASRNYGPPIAAIDVSQDGAADLISRSASGYIVIDK